MVKYLWAGLILIASLAAHPSTTSPDPVMASTSAEFVTVAGAIVTSVDINVNTLRGTARVGLTVYRHRQSCAGGVCQDVALMAGDTRQLVRPADASIDRFLASASLHLTMVFHDNVSHADLATRVDIVWVETGPTLCSVIRDAMGCLRPAAAQGVVAIGPLLLVTGRTDPGSWIQRRLWYLPTSSTVP